MRALTVPQRPPLSTLLRGRAGERGTTEERGRLSLLPLHQEHEYAIGLADGRLQWRGMSHAAAMVRAEALQRTGIVVSVMHVVGVHSYEVDRYPPRP